MSTEVIATKKVKISSKGQVTFTVPKKYLETIETTNGDELIVNFFKNKIEVYSQKQIFKDKIKNFKPISIGGNKKVNFSETHNDIYD